MTERTYQDKKNFYRVFIGVSLIVAVLTNGLQNGYLKVLLTTFIPLGNALLLIQNYYRYPYKNRKELRELIWTLIFIIVSNLTFYFRP